MSEEGFDSRHWNGVLPAQADPYSFYIAKATESDWFLSPDFEMQWNAGVRYFGDMVGAWHFYRYYGRHGSVAQPVDQAALYVGAIENVAGGLRAFPPIFDAEDVYAPPSLKTANHMNDTIMAIEDLLGKEVLMYTARWWWDVHIKPYVQPHHVFYDRLLWESDPPPDTPEPGEWTKEQTVMVQTVLDWAAPGFKSTTGQQGTIDVDEADEAWFGGLQPGNPNPIIQEYQVPEGTDQVILHLS